MRQPQSVTCNCGRGLRWEPYTRFEFVAHVRVRLAWVVARRVEAPHEPVFAPAVIGTVQRRVVHRVRARVVGHVGTGVLGQEGEPATAAVGVRAVVAQGRGVLVGAVRLERGAWPTVHALVFVRLHFHRHTVDATDAPTARSAGAFRHDDVVGGKPEDHEVLVHAAALHVRAELAQARLGALDLRLVEAVAARLERVLELVGVDLLRRVRPDVHVEQWAVVVVLLVRVVRVPGHERLREAAAPLDVARAHVAAPRILPVEVAVRHERWPVVGRVPAPALLVDELVHLARQLHRAVARGARGAGHLAALRGGDGRQLAAQLARRRRRVRRCGRRLRRRRVGRRVRHVGLLEREQQLGGRDHVARLVVGSAAELLLVEVELGPPDAHARGAPAAVGFGRRADGGGAHVRVEPRVEVAEAHHEARVVVEGAPQPEVDDGPRDQEEAAVAEPLG